MRNVNVCEIFVSVQGESTYAGLSCFFIRLAGCNLRCNYCDTKKAYGSGRNERITDLVRRCRTSGAAIAEITGGEPLLQEGFAALARELRDKSGKKVLVETNGSCDITSIPEGVVAIMDVKCPGSGENCSMDMANIGRLRPYDEVKFILGSRADYLWARKFVLKHKLAKRCHAVLFGPVFGRIKPVNLCKWITEDGLPVRFQLQLHKVLGVK